MGEEVEKLAAELRGLRLYPTLHEQAAATLERVQAKLDRFERTFDEAEVYVRHAEFAREQLRAQAAEAQVEALRKALTACVDWWNERTSKHPWDDAEDLLATLSSTAEERKGDMASRDPAPTLRSSLEIVPTADGRCFTDCTPDCVCNARALRQASLASSTPESSAQRGQALSDAIDEAWQDLLDKDDRTSPEEYPDMALITHDELASYMAFSLSASEQAGGTNLLERVAKASLDISTYAEHDFDCVQRTGEACDCGYTKASREVQDACEAAVQSLPAPAEARGSQPAPVAPDAPTPRTDGRQPPKGYAKLPAGERCKCIGLWQQAIGELWCCKGAAVDHG